MNNPEKKDREPYCTLLKEVREMLDIFSWHTEEAKWETTRAKQAMAAIQERTFERMYYQAREDLHDADKIIRNLPCVEEIATILFQVSIYVEMYGSWENLPDEYKKVFIKQAEPISKRIRR